MIATALTRYFEAERFRGLVAAYLFGSEAEQRGHRDSDIDVGVLVDRSVYTSPAARSSLRVDLSSALIGVTGRERAAVRQHMLDIELARTRSSSVGPQGAHGVERDRSPGGHP